MSEIPHRVSLANIGLAYLENAILDALGENSYLPWQLARKIGLYPNIRTGGDRLAGSLVVGGILEALEQQKRVQRSSFRPKEWELTEKERDLRGYY